MYTQIKIFTQNKHLTKQQEKKKKKNQEKIKLTKYKCVNNKQ